MDRTENGCQVDGVALNGLGMIYRLSVPPVEGVEEFRILEWHRSEGELVASDQLLVELETDKAIVEVRSPRSCVLRKIAVKQGDWTPIGGPPLAWLGDTANELLQTDEAVDLAPHFEVT
jgi:pyruvate/2-oxoglutarate dehydrogenase complex dihydrolipoamide acyltransferase (E2) component